MFFWSSTGRQGMRSVEPSSSQTPLWKNRSFRNSFGHLKIRKSSPVAVKPRGKNPWIQISFQLNGAFKEGGLRICLPAIGKTAKWLKQKKKFCQNRHSEQLHRTAAWRWACHLHGDHSDSYPWSKSHPFTCQHVTGE